jgi:Txe/YoeB family toxin of Txe-Axe toxin-antitoxin module
MAPREVRLDIGAACDDVAEHRVHVAQREGWKALRNLLCRGFHDEKLSGKLSRLRSSRLSLQWRVVYRAEDDVVTVHVERLTPHDYQP